MNADDFQKVFPLVRNWISLTLTANAENVRGVSSFGFSRLSSYYSKALLARAKVVIVENCPMPPLSSIGLKQFADFESMDPAGITYLDTYFIVSKHANVESLHFHELVHVIQWELLGAEKFLALYADGLERFGYRQSPLEIMAYDHEDRFKSACQPYSVENEVCDQLKIFG
jgi:hypothetical protein